MNPDTMSTPTTEAGSNGLLYGLGAAMIAVVVLAVVLIEEATLWALLLAVGGLIVGLGCVAVYIMRFIGETDDGH